MPQPAVREYRLYATGQKFRTANEHINSEEKSCDSWLYEQLHELNFITAKMILATSIATVATWSINCPFIKPFCLTQFTNSLGSKKE